MSKNGKQNRSTLFDKNEYFLKKETLKLEKKLIGEQL